jgi:hypothetical protein
MSRFGIDDNLIAEHLLFIKSSSIKVVLEPMGTSTLILLGVELVLV